MNAVDTLKKIAELLPINTISISITIKIKALFNILEIIFLYNYGTPIF